MRRLFTALLLTMFVLISIGVGHVSAQEMPYERPWIETDLNLYNLINDGYEIVGTVGSAVAMGSELVEIIYLKKKNNLYSCFTILTSKSGEGSHVCSILKEPKKIQ